MRGALLGLAAAALVGSAALAQPAAAPAAKPMPFQTVVDIADFKPLAKLTGVAKPQHIPVVDPARRTLSAPALAAAQAYSDAHKGKALLIWQGGKLQYERYAPGLDANTPFNVFSMTKSVLGLAYGAAIRDGVIRSLDDPAGLYLAEWKDDPRGDITLRQLLTMSSGLRLASLANPDPKTFAMILGDNVTRLALAEPAVEAPGVTFEYNNIDSQIAGVALDRALKAAGKVGYIDYLSKQIWQPVGQADAKLWLDPATGDPRFFTGLMATPRDWLRLGLLVKDHGKVGPRQVLPAAWIDEMTRSSATNPNYGLQVWLGQPFRNAVPAAPNRPAAVKASEPYLAPDLVYFNGAQDQRVYISRALDLVIVRIGEGTPGWDNAALLNAVARGMKR